MSSNLLTTPQAAKLVNLGERQLQKLAKEGWITKETRGKWDVVKLVRGILEYKDHLISSQAKNVSENELKASRKEELDIRIGIKKRELILLSEAVEAVEAVCGDTLSMLSGLPAQITRDQGERERIRKIIKQRQEKLANGFGKISQSLREGGNTSNT